MTSKEVAKALGLTYRQVDSWAHRLRIGDAAVGYGRQREWTDEEVALLREAIRLRREYEAAMAKLLAGRDLRSWSEVNYRKPRAS